MVFPTFSTLSFLLLPGRCLCCDLPSRRSRDLCAGCELTLPRAEQQCPRCAIPVPFPALCGQCQSNPPPFSRTLAPFVYAPPVDELLLRLKGSGQLAAGMMLGELLADHLEAAMATPGFTVPDVVAPVPLHWRRQLKRGFNQSRELALPVARRLGLDLAPGALKRLRAIQQQGKGRRERLRSMAGAFSASPRLRGQSVAIVDDVMTTGATLAAVADAVLQAGASDVQVWCLARGVLEK